MGLDISVTNTRTNESKDMNWLRNPFGLCAWAENNYGYVMERDVPEDMRLWYVVNHWNYDKALEVDKPLFLEVVMKYGKVILKLEQAYFWFSEPGFNQFIKPHIDVLPLSVGATFATYDYFYEALKRYYFYDKEYLGIPMQLLGHSCFGLSDRYRPNAHTLACYQDWYHELIEFAELLQDPDAEFYCSN